MAWEENSPSPWPVRGSAIRGKSCYGSEESRQRIDGFNRRIRAKGEACTVVDYIAERIQRLHAFWTLRRVSAIGELLRAIDVLDDLRRNTYH